MFKKKNVLVRKNYQVVQKWKKLLLILCN